VALAIKKKFPNAFGEYRKAFLAGELRVGRIFPVLISGTRECPKLLVVNAITQEFYGRDRRHVDYDGLKYCFELTATFAKRHGIQDIHFPLIGCGLAGGEWLVVAPIIEQALDGLNPHLWVLE
jgi:O-acetyl-ADP-ribose deacetylase (regulator of RNase III)